MLAELGFIVFLLMLALGLIRHYPRQGVGLVSVGPFDGFRAVDVRLGRCLFCARRGLGDSPVAELASS